MRRRLSALSPATTAASAFTPLASSIASRRLSPSILSRDCPTTARMMLTVTIPPRTMSRTKTATDGAVCHPSLTANITSLHPSSVTHWNAVINASSVESNAV